MTLVIQLNDNHDALFYFLLVSRFPKAQRNRHLQKGPMDELIKSVNVKEFSFYFLLFRQSLVLPIFVIRLLREVLVRQ